MSYERKLSLIGRWSLVSASAIGLFWLVWYLINGSVPVMTTVRMTSSWTLTLPFGISRWWDVLIGPIESTLIILLVTSEWINKNKNEDWFIGLISGLAYGLVFGLIYGLVSGLVFGLVFGLISGLVFGLIFGLAYGLTKLIRWLRGPSVWKAVVDWLLAR